MADKLAIWPQMTVLVLLGLAWVRSLVLHGQPVTESKHDSGKYTFGMVILLVLLGNGGFWKPLGW